SEDLEPVLLETRDPTPVRTDPEASFAVLGEGNDAVTREPVPSAIHAERAVAEEIDATAVRPHPEGARVVFEQGGYQVAGQAIPGGEGVELRIVKAVEQIG